MDGDLIQTKGQRGHHAIFLLEIQLRQLTVVLLCNTLCSHAVDVQLTLVVGGVHQQEGNKEHLLITALKVLQDTLGFGAIGGQVTGDDVHVVSGADCLLLFVDLALVKVGNLALDHPDSFCLIKGLDVHGDDQAGFEIQEVRQHTVVQFGREDLKERYRTDFFAHGEDAAVPELEGAGGDEVLGGQSTGRKPVPVEHETVRGIHVEDAVHQLQSSSAVQGLCTDAKFLEIGQNIKLNTVQARLGRFDAISFDAKGDVLGLCQAVVALGELVQQHGFIFRADRVEGIVSCGNADAVLKGFCFGAQIQKTELKADGRVEVIQEIAPAVKDRGLILIHCKLVVDVLILDGTGIVGISHPADTVWPHALIRDRILCSMRDFLIPSCTG